MIMNVLRGTVEVTQTTQYSTTIDLLVLTGSNCRYSLSVRIPLFQTSELIEDVMINYLGCSLPILFQQRHKPTSLL